jgi:cytochrome oxidase Cu insertion factor (SCO1/SenC/PrrC family)
MPVVRRTCETATLSRARVARRTGLAVSLMSVLGLTPLGSVPSAGVVNPSLYAEPWTWTEDSGRQVSLSTWRGQLVFLSMAYSSCRNTCAMTFHTLDLLQARLDRVGSAAQMIVVSYDPENDTAAAWAAFRKRRHLNRPNWHFLSGDPQTTRRLAKALGLSDFWSADRHVVHDYRIVRLDGDGRIARALRWNDSLDKVLP